MSRVNKAYISKKKTNEKQCCQRSFEVSEDQQVSRKVVRMTTRLIKSAFIIDCDASLQRVKLQTTRLASLLYVL
jgi:hypothetical protein